MVLDRRAAREHSVLAGLQGFCHKQGLGSPSPLVTEVIAAYLCQGLRDRAPSTKGTYHSVLRHLARTEEAKGHPSLRGIARALALQPARARAALLGRFEPATSLAPLLRAGVAGVGHPGRGCARVSWWRSRDATSPLAKRTSHCACAVRVNES